MKLRKYHHITLGIYINIITVVVLYNLSSGEWGHLSYAVFLIYFIRKSSMKISVFRMYAGRKIRDTFRANKSINDFDKIDQQIAVAKQNLEMLRRQVSFVNGVTKILMSNLSNKTSVSQVVVSILPILRCNTIEHSRITQTLVPLWMFFFIRYYSQKNIQEIKSLTGKQTNQKISTLQSFLVCLSN